jgi:hypothetical protein
MGFGLFGTDVGIEADVLPETWRDRCTVSEDEYPSLPDKRRKVFETFTIGMVGMIDVKMIGFGGGDYSHEGIELVEGTVELIGFGYGVRGIGKEKIGVVIFEYPPKESGTVERRLPEEVCGERTGSGLAMRTGNTEGKGIAGDFAK